AAGPGRVFLHRLQHVRRMLGADARIAGEVVAVPAWAMTCHAGRHTALRDARAINVLAEPDELGGRALLPERLRGVIGGEVEHVLIGEHHREVLHPRVLPLAVLVSLQLIVDVARVLTGEARPLGRHAVAVDAVARRARRRLLPSGVDRPPENDVLFRLLGRGRCGQYGCRDEGDGGEHRRGPHSAAARFVDHLVHALGNFPGAFVGVRRGLYTRSPLRWGDALATASLLG